MHGSYPQAYADNRRSTRVQFQKDTMTRDEFVRALDREVARLCGLGYDDLPDLIRIDDYYDERMNRKMAEAAVAKAAKACYRKAREFMGF